MNKYYGKTIAVLGMGITGEATVEFLIQSGAKVYLSDDRNLSEIIIAQNILAKYGNTTEYMRPAFLQPDKINLHNIDILSIGPGINPDHPIVKKARNINLPITCDMDIFYNTVSNKSCIIGITGTNGKSTVTSLIGHILQQNNYDTVIAGNIGKPIASVRRDAAFYVIELSSFQLDIISDMLLDIAVLLNITPDHLDRYHTVNAYIKSKLNIFNKVKVNGHKILCTDSDPCMQFYDQRSLNENYISVSTRESLNRQHISVNIDYINDRINNIQQPLPQTKYFNITTNLANIGAAYAACMSFIKANEFTNALIDFKPLPHRLENVAKYRNITLINDSKATNTASTELALGNYHNIFWIAGGIFKEQDLQLTVKSLLNIRKAFLIGQSAEKFAEFLSKHNIKYDVCITLKAAMYKAFQEALLQSEPINILLSPACSSYDQWQNFERRGEAFINLTHQIIKEQK